MKIVDTGSSPCATSGQVGVELDRPLSTKAKLVQKVSALYQSAKSVLSNPMVRGALCIGATVCVLAWLAKRRVGSQVGSQRSREAADLVLENFYNGHPIFEVTIQHGNEAPTKVLSKQPLNREFAAWLRSPNPQLPKIVHKRLGARLRDLRGDKTVTACRKWENEKNDRADQIGALALKNWFIENGSSVETMLEAKDKFVSETAPLHAAAREYVHTLMHSF